MPYAGGEGRHKAYGMRSLDDIEGIEDSEEPKFFWSAKELRNYGGFRATGRLRVWLWLWRYYWSFLRVSGKRGSGAVVSSDISDVHHCLLAIV